MRSRWRVYKPRILRYERPQSDLFNFPIMFLLDLIIAPALQSSSSNFPGCFSHRTPKPVNSINGHTSYLESCKSATRLKFPASTASSKVDGLNQNTVQPLMVNFELFSQQQVWRLSKINKSLILIERATAPRLTRLLSYSGPHIIIIIIIIIVVVIIIVIITIIITITTTTTTIRQHKRNNK